MWNWSFPANFTMYLLAQMRPASRASLDSCSYSLDTRCTHIGKCSTGVFLAPRSKILIFASCGERGGGGGGGIKEEREGSRLFLLPREHLSSPGTPLQNLDLGYGLFLQYL